MWLSVVVDMSALYLQFVSTNFQILWPAPGTWHPWNVIPCAYFTSCLSLWFFLASNFAAGSTNLLFKSQFGRFAIKWPWIIISWDGKTHVNVIRMIGKNSVIWGWGELLWNGSLLRHPMQNELRLSLSPFYLSIVFHLTVFYLISSLLNSPRHRVNVSYKKNNNIKKNKKKSLFSLEFYFSFSVYFSLFHFSPSYGFVVLS